MWLAWDYFTWTTLPEDYLNHTQTAEHASYCSAVGSVTLTVSSGSPVFFEPCACREKKNIIIGLLPVISILSSAHRPLLILLTWRHSIQRTLSSGHCMLPGTQQPEKGRENSISERILTVPHEQRKSKHSYQSSRLLFSTIPEHHCNRRRAPRPTKKGESDRLAYTRQNSAAHDAILTGQRRTPRAFIYRLVLSSNPHENAKIS